jgi:hypothetical protein
MVWPHTETCREGGTAAAVWKVTPGSAATAVRNEAYDAVSFFAPESHTCFTR